MSALEKEKCVPCSGGATPASNEEIKEMAKSIPEWQVYDTDGIDMLERVYKFKNWKKAQDFAMRIGALAEDEQHHPAILLEWGKVKITWWTHAISGLHKNDFICAAKTDEIFNDV
jgi:4a-hydroxytetrahydrobiopterin dehydratase